jgi:lipoprotein Spr
MLLTNACKHQQKTTTEHKKNEKVEHQNTPQTSGAEKILIEKLGFTKHEIKKSKLFSFVCEWYTTPYLYGGCKKTGVDCSCFANLLYDEVYHTNITRTAGEMFKQCKQISSEDAKEGDLYFFKINSDKISHVGICIKQDYFVHASVSKGVVLSSLNETYYKKYFYCAGRIKKS